MPPPRAASAAEPRAAAVLESLAAVILCVAIVVGPLALGGTPPWVRFSLEAALAAAAVLWAVARPRAIRKLVIPLAVAGLVLGQLVPLPDRWLTALAPVSAGAWKVVHEGMPDAWGRISITPAASAATARRLLLGMATIVAVVDLSRDPRRRRWLYTALATAGVLVWAIAFVFPVNREDRSLYGGRVALRGPLESWKTYERAFDQTSGVGYLDWITVGQQRYQADAPIPGDGFGPYIYSNHFANALCLTVPAICAMWLVLVGRRLPRPAALLVVAAIFAAAVWTTGPRAGSRAGTASLLCAAAVFGSLVLEPRWLRWLCGGVAATGLAALLGFMAMFQGPLHGLTTLAPAAWQPSITAALGDARIVAARNAGRMFLASPVFGTGLGSYGDMFPRFVGGDRVMYFAHNDHAQLLAEAGLAGLVVLGCFAGLLGWRFVRLCRERRPASRTVDAAAWAAVAAAAAHSVFDWNMHAPANALLACVVVGLAVSSVVSAATNAPPRGWTWGSRLMTGAFVAAVLGSLGWLARDAAVDSLLDELRLALSAARQATAANEHAAAAERLGAAITAGEAAASSPAYSGSPWQLPVLLGQAQLHRAHAAKMAAKAGPMEPSESRPAAEWFREAMLASPAYRGVAEPVPKK